MIQVCCLLTIRLPLQCCCNLFNSVFVANLVATFRIKTLGVQNGFLQERVEARLMLLFRRPLEAVRPITVGNGAIVKKVSTGPWQSASATP